MSEKAKKSDDAIPKGCVVSDEEMAFYKKLFPSFDIITKRKIHCTVCRGHLGCAPGKEDEIKMHPVLRVMQCTDCHEFYSSGEFSRGEDGSELYCRWCGQGGQVYCCSSCPYVFCKSCIVENLNKGVVRDIEENDSWNCFSCSSKIIWPLRAMHWALTKYIVREKELILSGNNTPSQIEDLMALDNSTCCRNKTTLNKSAILANTQKRRATQSPQITQPNKKTRSSLPITPKLGSGSTAPAVTVPSNNILEPTCQLTTPSAPPPLVMQSQQMTSNVLNKQPQYRIPASIKQTVRPLGKPTQLNRGSVPLAPRMSGPRATSGATSLGGGATTIRLSSNQMGANQTPMQRRQISTITATTTNTSGPVYHTINGYRIDLNSASKQDNFRLPNGKLIQVKRQVPVIPGAQPTQPAPVSSTVTSPTHTFSMNHQYIRPSIRPHPQQLQHQQQQHMQTQQQQQQILIHRNPPVPQQFIIHTPPVQQQQMHQQQQQHHQQHQHQHAHQQQPSTIQYRQIPQLQPAANQSSIPPGVIGQQNIALKSIPNFIKQIFPSTPLGVARNTLQSQLFHTMEICHHLMTKTHTMTNSNAYKTVHNLMDVKELYIHLSYLLTYAIGRFKGLQDKCLNDMKSLGFIQEARNLEKGQLAKDNLTSHNDDDLAIVEPQRDTIELDSDVEDDIPRIKIEKQDKHTMETTLNSLNMPISSNFGSNSDSEDIDLNVAADLLAGMLEVELTEGDPSELRQPKVKMPRTKTTKRKQRPNSPTTQAERAKIKALQNLKDSDKKLKMNCVVLLERIDVPPIDGEKDSNAKPSEKEDVASEKVVEKEVVSEKTSSKVIEKEQVSEEKVSEEKVSEEASPKVVEEEKVSEETSPNKEKVIELDSADEEKNEKAKEDESKKDDEPIKEKVIELDSVDDEKEKEIQKEKSKPLEDSDKMTVIDLDDDDEKTEAPKESNKSSSSPKPSDNEVIDLDDDDETEKDKTNKSSEVINIDDDDEEAGSDTATPEKMDVDKEADGNDSSKNDKSKESPEKANDIFEISEDEEDEIKKVENDKADEVVQKDKVAQSDDEEEGSSKNDAESSNKVDEDSITEEATVDISGKVDEEGSKVEENVDISGEKDKDGNEEEEGIKEKEVDSNTIENDIVGEDDSPKVDEESNIESPEKMEIEEPEKEIKEVEALDAETTDTVDEVLEDGIVTENNVTEEANCESETLPTEEEISADVEQVKEVGKDETCKEPTEQIKPNDEEIKIDCDSKTSDDLTQSPQEQTATTNPNGKVYVDGKELDENDFESSSSSDDEEEEGDQGKKENSVQDDVEMKDIETEESKETQSNGFGSENSSSNFDLIESMIKENLNVPTPDKSKIEESNNGMLTTAANEV